MRTVDRVASHWLLNVGGVLDSSLLEENKMHWTFKHKNK